MTVLGSYIARMQQLSRAIARLQCHFLLDETINRCYITRWLQLMLSSLSARRFLATRSLWQEAFIIEAKIHQHQDNYS